MDRLLKINEIAEILNISLDRAYTLSREGIIPSVRIGRSLRFSEGDIDNFIKQGGRGYEESWTGITQQKLWSEIVEERGDAHLV